MQGLFVGRIEQLTRYPVKSFAGESLESCPVTAYGLNGDRVHAFIDETKQGHARYITARQVPEMLGYRAKLLPGSGEDGIPEVRITSPQGAIFRWDEELLREMEAFYGHRLAMRRYRADGSEPTAVDDQSILLITDASLRRLREMWGEPLDLRRFRANVLLRLPSDTPFIENGWIGGKLCIGDVELQLESQCERCVITTMDPQMRGKNPSLLRTIAQELAGCFGVYASVCRTGNIRVGDPVYFHN